MALRSRFGPRIRIPDITSKKEQTKALSYKKGLKTYLPNDETPHDQVVYATDSRFRTIGRYKTRKGCDRWSIPVGEVVDTEQSALTGADTFSVTNTTYIAEKFTASTDGGATKVSVRVRRTPDTVGVLLVSLHADEGGVPGAMLARSSFSPSAIQDTFDDHDAYFIAAPQLASGTDFWVVVSGQRSLIDGYEVSTTTDSANAAISTDSGATWTPQAYSINFSISTSDAKGVKGLFKAFRPNGQRITFMAHDTSLYTIDEVTGAPTAIKDDFPSGAERYRFQMVQDGLYFCNGVEKPWTYNFEDEEFTQLNTPSNAFLIMEHVGLIFFADPDDKTRIYYSNFAEYDKYTSTDFIYVPAPKSYDSLRAMAKLNGVLFLFANRNKFQLLGADNATFNLDEALGQKGTFSQESVVFDHNYIYFASDDGIYQFNGTEEKNIAEDILEDYLAIGNKENIVLDLYKNRLYVFYTPGGAAENRECFVYNTLLGVWESQDMETWIGRSFGRGSQDDIYLQASNRVGAVYKAEEVTNDYNNLGDVLHWEIRTAYDHFDRPSQLKRIPKWRPSFQQTVLPYSVQVGYAVDLNNDVTYQDVVLSGSGPTYDSGLNYDEGHRYSGAGAIVEPKSLYIPGTYHRIQRRYQHVAAREPVEFGSEVVTIETQRII